MAMSASAAIIAACVRKETPRARLRFGLTPRRDGRRTGDENRSAADWLSARGTFGGCSKKKGSTQSTQKAGRLHNFSSCAWIRLLVEVEGDFDLHAAIYRLAAGAYRRAHLPILHLRHGFFFQAEAGPFENLRIEYTSI